MGNLLVFLCFRHSLRLLVAIPGQPDASRDFSIFSKKLLFVELGGNLKILYGNLQIWIGNLEIWDGHLQIWDGI